MLLKLALDFGFALSQGSFLLEAKIDDRLLFDMLFDGFLVVEPKEIYRKPDGPPE